MGPWKSNSSYTFDRPETIRDRTKMNLAGHRDRRLSENYFEPWERFKTNTKLWKIAILKNFESRINSNNIDPLKFKGLPPNHSLILRFFRFWEYIVLRVTILRSTTRSFSNSSDSTILGVRIFVTLFKKKTPILSFLQFYNFIIFLQTLYERGRY